MERRPSQSFELERLARNLRDLERGRGMTPPKPRPTRQDRALLLAVLLGWAAVAFVLAAAARAFWPHPH